MGLPQYPSMRAIAAVGLGEGGKEEVRGLDEEEEEAGAFSHPELRQAMAWLIEAARRNNTAAQRSLGHFYLRGHGVRQDNKTGIAWIALAAKSGDAGAQVCWRMSTYADAADVC